MAVPFAVAAVTVTVPVAAADRLTVNVAALVPALPSVMLTSLMLSDGSAGASSSTIVATPWPSAMVRADGRRQIGEEGFVAFLRGVAVDRDAARA